MADESDHVVEETKECASSISSSQRARIPGFWGTAPENWFSMAEILFDANKITADKQKFAQTISCLSPEQAEMVNDVLRYPPVADRYQHLKKVLIERNSLSQEKKLEALLDKTEMGDQRPSDVLRRIRMLADNTYRENLIVQLWIRKLPEFIQIALIPQQDKEVEMLANIADRLHDAMPNSHVQSVTSRSRPTTRRDSAAGPSEELTIQDLAKEIKELRQEMERLRVGNRHAEDSRSRRRSPSARRRRSQSRRRYGDTSVCYNHFKWGNAAWSCQKPCSFPERRQQDSQGSTRQDVGQQRDTKYPPQAGQSGNKNNDSPN